MYQKVKAIKDPALYAAWAAERPWCQACGIPDREAQSKRWPGLSTHHVCRFKRSDERTNLLRLCKRCHDLAEGLTYRVAGVVLPTLPLPVCLSIKLARDPGEYDPARLAVLYGRSLPDPQPIPPFLVAEYATWRPWETPAGEDHEREDDGSDSVTVGIRTD